MNESEYVLLLTVKNEHVALVVVATLLAGYCSWLQVEGVENGCGGYDIMVRRTSGKPITDYGVTRIKLLNYVRIVMRTYGVMVSELEFKSDMI